MGITAIYSSKLYAHSRPMIRSIKLRLCARALVYRSPFPPPGPPRRFGSSSSHALESEPEPSAQQSEEIEEPYGNQYGPGPSRLPYTPPRPTSLNPPRRHPTAPHALSPGEQSALERVKSYLGGVKEITDEHVEYILDPTRFAFDKMRRMDVTALLKHLIETERPLLAARFMMRSIDRDLPQLSRNGGIYSMRQVGDVFEAATRPTTLGDRDDPDCRLKPRGTEDIDVLLPLLNSLRRIRNPRNIKVYTCLIQRLCAEGLYDTAAKVYVELAEEWIIEGRMAFGADPQSFYEGGGPPREGRAEWELRSGLYKTWWKGVRTWVLPGEVLSPHDRLDLWHPRKLRLPERLRKFPMPIPNAPPTIVPHPPYQIMLTIADHLQLDPETATADAFERSMRACAILASTILSRTMPYLPARLLRDVLDRTPMDPPVYPEHIKDPPTGDDAWAFTAHTHIHLAIRSVLLSPPTRPALFKYMIEFDKAQSEDLPLPDVPKPWAYKTAPLSFAACRFLAMYAVRKMNSVISVKALYQYVRATWGSSRITGLHSILLRGIALQKSTIAWKFDKILFGNTQLGSDAPNLSPVRSPRKLSKYAQDAARDDPEAIWGASVAPGDGSGLTPDSLNSLLRYLTSTSQKDRFLDSVYRIVPFLQYSRSLDPTVIGDPEGMLDDSVEQTGRPRPVALTPELYSTIMLGLAKFGTFGLGQRIFQLALQAEDEWSKHYLPDENIPEEHRLQIDTFTSMLMLWQVIANRVASGSQSATVRGWNMPLGYGSQQMPIEDVVQALIWKTYRYARARWMAAMWDRSNGTANGIANTELAGHSAPNARFFNEFLKARAARWGLSTKEQGYGYGLMTPEPGAAKEKADQPSDVKKMFVVARDMDRWGFEVPVVLRIRLGLIPPMTKQEVDALSHNDIRLLTRTSLKVAPPKASKVFTASPSVEAEVELSPEEWSELEEEWTEGEERADGYDDGQEKRSRGMVHV